MVQKALKKNMARWNDDLTHIKTSIPGNPVGALMVGMSHKITEKLLNPTGPMLGDSRGGTDSQATSSRLSSKPQNPNVNRFSGKVDPPALTTAEGKWRPEI